jgi:hypothetical protein
VVATDIKKLTGGGVELVIAACIPQWINVGRGRRCPMSMLAQSQEPEG